MQYSPRIIANASVYFRQFYLVSNFSDYDPRSVSLACLYLASKVEEASVSAKDLFQIMKTFQGQHLAQRVTKIEARLQL